MSAEAWRRTGTDWAPLDLRGRRGAFRTFIDVRGSLATNWDWTDWAPLRLT